MKAVIQSQLDEVEQQHNVKVLYAVESGSRAWGFASPDSDYDVRFIYCRPPQEYLRLNRPGDVIEHVLDKQLDISGWDIDKALKLLHSSNPTLFEWFNSPIVYRRTDAFDAVLPELAAFYQGNKGFYHYLHMAQSNYQANFKHDYAKIKKYFYVIRPILACRWIINRRSAPPVPFGELVDTQLETDMLLPVADLIARKSRADESKKVPRIRIWDEWIEHNLELLQAESGHMKKEGARDWQFLDALFLKLIQFDCHLQ